MEIFKLVISYLENLVSITTSEPMTFVNISSPGDLRRRLANIIANISQRHKAYWVCVVKYVILFKNMFYMMCFWTAAIGYLLEEIQIDLNVRFGDQHYAFGVG